MKGKGKSEMTVGEAGRKGGLATSRTHDKEFYQEIGRKGGEANAQKIQEEGIPLETRMKLSKAGHKGGVATRRLHGRKFYQEIGRKGGSMPKKHVEVVIEVNDETTETGNRINDTVQDN